MNERSEPAVRSSSDVTVGPLEGVPLDVTYDLLRNRRRRLVLHHLVDAPGNRSDIGDLATQLAAWENDEPLEAVTSTERKRTYNTLQQTHLPKLAEAGIVDYDRNRGTVVLESEPRHLRIFLEFLPKAGGPTVRRILALETAVWSFLAAKWAGVHLLGVLAPAFAVQVTPVAVLVMVTLNALLLYYFW
ncbi:MAG: hypothetical protein ABEJ70_04615 [Halobacteriaceae archaeon]